MPDDKIEITELQKEQKDFEDAFDELEVNESKSDEEIQKDLDEAEKKKKEEADAASGDATKDQSQTSDKDSAKPQDNTDGMFVSGQESTDGKPAVDSTATQNKDELSVTELTEKVTSLEEELSKEKQKTASWNGRITAANKNSETLQDRITELEALQTTSKKDSDNATVDADKEVLDKFREDFPELKDVIDILQRRVDDVTKGTKADKKPDGSKSAKTEVVPDVVPATGKTEHIAAIHKVHPDLDEMVGSGVLKTWINKQKPFIQSHLETIYANGNSQQIIEMVTQFKDTTGWKSQLNTEDTTKQDKLKSMLEVNSESATPSGTVVDKDDYDQGAKDAGLV